MAWNGIQPIVHLIEGIYEKGVNVLPEVLEACQSFWNVLTSYPNGISPSPRINQDYFFTRVPRRIIRVSLAIV